VYHFNENYYVAQIGGSSPFSDRNEIFLNETEEEIFSVSGSFEKSFIEILRKMIAEVDKLGIKRIIGTEDLPRGSIRRRSPRTNSSNMN